MKIYELQPNVEYRDVRTNIGYRIDTTGSYAGDNVLASTRGGLWDCCYDSYTDLLRMDFEPVCKQ